MAGWRPARGAPVPLTAVPGSGKRAVSGAWRGVRHGFPPGREESLPARHLAIIEICPLADLAARTRAHLPITAVLQPLERELCRGDCHADQTDREPRHGYEEPHHSCDEPNEFAGHVDVPLGVGLLRPPADRGVHSKGRTADKLSKRVAGRKGGADIL